MIHQIDPRLNLYRVRRRIRGNVEFTKNGNVTIVRETPPFEIDVVIQVFHTTKRTVIQFVTVRPTWQRIDGKPSNIRRLRYAITSIYDAITIQYARRVHIPNMARIEQVAVDRIMERLARKETQNVNEHTHRN